MNRLTLEIACETAETGSLEVAACDESESETRITPEKLKSRDDMFERIDREGYTRIFSPYHNSDDLRYRQRFHLEYPTDAQGEET
jgi:hypothetical protein